MTGTKLDLAYGWASITKSEKQADGTLLVKGVITDDGIDRDQQVCDTQWLDDAVPRWFGEGANVREMHAATAAGVGVSTWKDDGGQHWLEAKVVDPVSVLKVETGVLKGFSIGIKNPVVVKDDSAPNGRISGGDIIEVSLVDRPANPRALLALAKSDGTDVLAPVEQELAGDVVTVDKVLADVQGIVKAAAEGMDDETTDIAGALAAIKAVAALIEHEAQSLGEGQMDEVIDIRLLTGAVEALQWFLAREQYDMDDDFDDIPDLMSLMDEADWMKRDYSDKTRKEMAAAGEAMPGGGFPIRTKKDVENAVRSIGRAKDPAAAKKHIISRAKALDCMDLIPDSWNASKAEEADKTTTETVVAGDDVAAKVETLVQQAVAKASEAQKAEIESLRAELAKVQAMPTGGGPVRIRTQEQRVLGDDADRRALLAQADEEMRKADSATDRDLRDAYLAKARDLRSKANM